jgi:U3 small nucleolar RNA-associated protein 21
MADALFQPFRALGYITDSVPFAVNRRGKKTWITVSVGKAWQSFDCTKLTLALVGPQVCTRQLKIPKLCDLTRNAYRIATGVAFAVARQNYSPRL